MRAPKGSAEVEQVCRLSHDKVARTPFSRSTLAVDS